MFNKDLIVNRIIDLVLASEVSSLSRFTSDLCCTLRRSSDPSQIITTYLVRHMLKDMIKSKEV